MKRAASIAVIVALVSATAHAQECTSAVKVESPCTGVLLPTRAAADAMKCLKTAKGRCDADKKKLESDCDAKIKRAQAVASLERDRADKLSELLDKSLQKAPPEKPAFWESSMFWGVAGFVVGAVSATTAIYFGNSSRN